MSRISQSLISSLIQESSQVLEIGSRANRPIDLDIQLIDWGNDRTVRALSSPGLRLIDCAVQSGKFWRWFGTARTVGRTGRRRHPADTPTQMAAATTKSVRRRAQFLETKSRIPWHCLSLSLKTDPALNEPKLGIKITIV